MQSNKFYYIIHIQYLGFRFHGWAKQPKIKTVHHMIDRTLTYVFGHSDFKTLGGSRTDAMVSANDFVLELFCQEELEETAFLESFNLNLPADIKALSIDATDASFNVIQNPKIKQYIYLFAFGEKAHPFSAPFITTVQSELNIELMKKGAQLFEGEHDFKAYCKQPNENTNTKRRIDTCRLSPNEYLHASFFPENAYSVTFESKGFLRNQIRMIMGQLLKLGKEEISLDLIQASLESGFEEKFTEIAPASGLFLNNVKLS